MLLSNVLFQASMKCIVTKREIRGIAFEPLIRGRPPWKYLFVISGKSLRAPIGESFELAADSRRTSYLWRDRWVVDFMWRTHQVRHTQTCHVHSYVLTYQQVSITGHKCVTYVVMPMTGHGIIIYRVQMCHVQGNVRSYVTKCAYDVLLKTTLFF